MIFKVNEHKKLSSFKSTWNPRELEVEDYIIPTDSEEPLLDTAIFGEPLLMLKNQALTKDKKRADILALDRMGNLVIIELKRDIGTLGVETQALQYLSAFSVYKGDKFLSHFSRDVNKDIILGFLGGNVSQDDINRCSRVILVARAFDPSLFSIGEWLSNNGVAFRCITYTPFNIEQQNFLSFSVAFDRAPIAIYPLLFQNNLRSPAFFWHNIGVPTDKWWKYLVEKGIITASYNNQQGDEGERLLRSYIKGDKIIAYAKGCGAVGYGEIKDLNYSLVLPNSADDFLKNGDHLHRLKIKWVATAEEIKDGITPKSLREDYLIYHPISTSVTIPDENAKKLISALDNKFKPNLTKK